MFLTCGKDERKTNEFSMSSNSRDLQNWWLIAETIGNQCRRKAIKHKYCVLLPAWAFSRIFHVLVIWGSKGKKFNFKSPKVKAISRIWDWTIYIYRIGNQLDRKQLIWNIRLQMLSPLNTCSTIKLEYKRQDRVNWLNIFLLCFFFLLT